MTIEGLGDDESLDPVQQAFLDTGAVQCGFCTPGMVIATHALLCRHPQPDELTVREELSGNLCRCTGYQKILDAVNRATEAKGPE